MFYAGQRGGATTLMMDLALRVHPELIIFVQKTHGEGRVLDTPRHRDVYAGSTRSGTCMMKIVDHEYIDHTPCFDLILEAQHEMCRAGHIDSVPLPLMGCSTVSVTTDSGTPMGVMVWYVHGREAFSWPTYHHRTVVRASTVPCIRACVGWPS